MIGASVGIALWNLTPSPHGYSTWDYATVVSYRLLLLRLLRRSYWIQSKPRLTLLLLYLDRGSRGKSKIFTIVSSLRLSFLWKHPKSVRSTDEFGNCRGFDAIDCEKRFWIGGISYCIDSSRMIRLIKFYNFLFLKKREISVKSINLQNFNRRDRV